MSTTSLNATPNLDAATIQGPALENTNTELSEVLQKNHEHINVSYLLCNMMLDVEKAKGQMIEANNKKIAEKNSHIGSIHAILKEVQNQLENPDAKEISLTDVNSHVNTLTAAIPDLKKHLEKGSITRKAAETLWLELTSNSDRLTEDMRKLAQDNNIHFEDRRLMVPMAEKLMREWDELVKRILQKSVGR